VRPRGPRRPAPASEGADETAPDVVRVGKWRVLAAATGLQVLVLGAVLAEQAGVELSLFRPVIAVAYLSLVPGMLGVALLMVDGDLPTVIGYVVGLSMVVTMAVGGATSVLLPRLGLADPMAPLPLLASMTVTVAVLGGALARQRSTVEVGIPVGSLARPFPLALLLVPLVSVLGTAHLARGGSNAVLLGLLVAVAVLPLALVARAHTSRWHSLAVWSVSAALVYHGGLWPFTGGHQLSTITVEQGRWVANYGGGIGSLLPNGVLYPAYAQLGGLSVAVEFGAVNPLLVSLLPLLLLTAFRRQTDDRTALIGACLFAFSFPFYTIYPGGGRIATPVFFLALTALAVSHDGLSDRARRTLTLLFGTGIAVSHYGTAWVVMGAFGLSTAVFVAIRSADGLRPGPDTPEPTSAATDGGVRSLSWLRAGGVDSQLLRYTFVGFYSTFALGWYLYTANGAKFSTLPSHVVGGVRDLLFGGALTGAATRSAVKNYGSASIAASRQLYILFGALMALGVAVAVWKRTVRGERVVGDEFLALGTGFLAVLGSAFLPVSTGFNTARVMMIVFVFTAPFVTVGAGATVDALTRLRRGIVAGVRNDGPAASASETASGRPVLVGLACVLAVFLLLNTGVVAELVTDDYAPSNAVSQERLSESADPVERARVSDCRACTIQTHVWLLNHRDPSVPAYGDFQAGGEIDYFRGQITAQVGGVPTSPYRSIWSLRNGTDNATYLVLRPINLDTGGVFVDGKYDWRPLAPSADLFEASNVVYTTGESRVYATSNRSDAGGPVHARPDRK